MPKLCQILAIEKQTKTTSGEQLNAVYHALQKDALLSGITRTYEPLNEEGEKFPAEKQEVQLRVSQAIDAVRDAVSPLYDIVAARDLANCIAKADVEVDGVTILKGLPAVTLLYLEKQLVDLQTVIGKLPELPQTDTWKFDQNADCYITDPVQTAKSKKIAKPFVKYEATKEHPAQVEVVHEDVLQGYWTTVKFSGGLPRDKKRVLRERVEKLLSAVKFAREAANQADAPKVSIAKELFGYLLA